MSRSFPILRTSLVLGTFFVGLASTRSVAATPQVGDSSASKPDVLVDLSRRISALRQATRGISLRVSHGEGSVRGIYLGKGLIATPCIPELERGSSAMLMTSEGLFRLRALGSVGRSPASKPLVTFFELRDPFDEYAPPKGAPAQRGWREKVGDMVLICNRSTARFGFVRQSFGMRSDRKFSMQAAGPSDDAYLHMLDADDVEPGSAVFDVTGRLVGMTLQFERPSRRRSRRSDPARGAGEDTATNRTANRAPNRAASRTKEEQQAAKGAGNESGAKSGATVGDAARARDKRATPSEAVRTTLVAMDVHWLLARGEHELEDKLPPAAASVGVNLNEVEAEGEGGHGRFVVSRVMMATPAHRAGARRGDTWLRIDGVALTSFDQLKQAIRTRSRITVSYSRKGVESKYVIRPR